MVLGPACEGPGPVEPWQVEQVEQVEGGLRGEHREGTGPMDSASPAVHIEGSGL